MGLEKNRYIYFDFGNVSTTFAPDPQSVLEGLPNVAAPLDRQSD